MIRERKNCRACGGAHLALVLDFGKTALANDFLPPEQVAQYKTILPLRLCVCRDCSLAQLAETVSPEVLYSSYAYVTSTSKTMDAHLTLQRDHLLQLGGFDRPARVLEIASNTGLYLKKFRESGCEVLGVEPARNIAEVANADRIPTRVEFFNALTAKRICEEWGQADLLLGRHVFAHIDDLQDLLAALEILSHHGTIVAFEVPYLIDLFERTEFDTIYHEHLSYVSATAVEALVSRSPFFLQRVDHYPIHGGSMLFHLKLRGGGANTHASVARSLELEKRLRLRDPACWEPFVKRVRAIQAELPALLRRLKSGGKRIVGYGASAKGNTLLNTCGLTAKDLDYIIDNTPFKQNRVAPGSWIPIRGPEWLLKDRPDYALLLAWNFATEIAQRETAYQEAGGRFIVPIPFPKVIDFTP